MVSAALSVVAADAVERFKVDLDKVRLENTGVDGEKAFVHVGTKEAMASAIDAALENFIFVYSLLFDAVKLR